MKTEPHSHKKGDHGLEIAIHPDDLRVKVKCKIVEGQSTYGNEEVPEIKYPNRYGPTNNVIQSDQSFAVWFKWTCYGPLACLLDCGCWETKVIFEYMGGGETNYSPEAITQDIGIPGHEYHSKVVIPPKTMKPGVYRVICCIQYCLKDGRPGFIAGFWDEGLIKIYDDKKHYHRPYSAPVAAATPEPVVVPANGSSETEPA